MTEPRILADFPKCGLCGSKEKVSELGCADSKAKGKMEPDTFTHLSMQAIPVEQPLMAGVMVPTIVTHYDVCAGCGASRCTRAEFIMAPVQFQQIPGNVVKTTNFPGESHEGHRQTPRGKRL